MTTTALRSTSNLAHDVIGGKIEAPHLMEKEHVVDGLKYLVSDHNVFQKMFKDYTSCTDVQKGDLILQLIREVSQHSSVEERFVYPLFKKYFDHPYSTNITDSLILDHQLAKMVMHQLSRMDPTKDGEFYDRAAQTLFHLLNAHMEFEERKFEELRTKMTPEELANLETKLRKGKTMAPIRAHPAAPTSGIGAKVTHPIAGALEKAMYKISNIGKRKT